MVNHSKEKVRVHMNVVPQMLSPTFSVRPCSSVGRATVDLIRRLWVRFPPRSKDFFFASCSYLFPWKFQNNGREPGMENFILADKLLTHLGEMLRSQVKPDITTELMSKAKKLKGYLLSEFQANLKIHNHCATQAWVKRRTSHEPNLMTIYVDSNN